MKAKTFLAQQNYISELSILEHVILWLNVGTSFIFFLVQLGLGYWNMPETWLAFVASIISIFASMAGAKKRILCPFLGIVASIFLIALAWLKHMYGSMIMYSLNIVIQIWSLITWYRSSKNKISIEPKEISWWVTLIYLLAFVGLSALFTWVEQVPGFAQFWSGNPDAEPEALPIRIFDSANLMFTISCFLPMVKRYDKVWYCYILSDLAISFLWLTKSIQDPGIFDNWTMVVSGLCMTATCFLGLFNWMKTKKQTQTNK